MRYLVSREVRADVTEVDFFEQYLPGIAVLARLSYTQDAQFIPQLSGTLEAASAGFSESPVVQALMHGGIGHIGSEIGRGGYDLVVVTSPVGAAAICEVPRTQRPPVVAVLPAFSVKGTWIHPGCDLYFVATKEVREDLVMAGIPYTRIVVSGIPSEVTQRQSSRAEFRKRAGVVDRFTVVLGGAGHSSADVRFIAATLARHGIQVVAVPGREARVVRQLHRLAESNALLHVIESREESRAVLLADVVLARAGGQVLLEAVCGGVPSIIYNPVASQESANVDFLVNAGTSLLSRDDDDSVEKVRFLSGHPDRLAQMTEATCSVGRNNVSKLVTDRLAAFAQ
jgi:processive 1,2-diacylglycerol beta-glucosyltransferase